MNILLCTYFYDFRRKAVRNMMNTALNIAKYVITKCTKDGCPISNLQLQKILYNLQKAYLQKGSELFSDEIQAWQWGPVVPNVYNVYCVYGSMKIVEMYSVELNESIMKIIDPIIIQKRNVNPWLLVDETHKKNGAWDRIYRNGIGNKHAIPCELIKAFG